MKKYLFTGLVAVLMMGACKKDYTAGFNTSLSNYYLNQSITFNNTSTGGTSSWDFGDGAKSTDKSPSHSYNQPGDYNVTLTDGSSVATQKVTIYHGTAAFKVDNETGVNLSLFTFSADASDYEIDYIDQGTVNASTQGTVYYTTDSTIYVGGTLPGTDSTFLVAPPNYPYVLTKNTVNTLSIDGNTNIYILNSLPDKKTKVQNLQSKALARKTNMVKMLAKHTVQ